jgi:hypothetical protein
MYAEAAEAVDVDGGGTPLIYVDRKLGGGGGRPSA